MINKRLIALSGNAKFYVFQTVLLQWAGLLASAVIVFQVAGVIDSALSGVLDAPKIISSIVAAALAAAVRGFCSFLSAKSSFKASTGVKAVLREKLFAKLAAIGGEYTESLSTAETLQTATEGVDQLEAYFSRFFPQFFYSLLAPITLFAIIAPISLSVSLVLLACAPLIPALIFMIMKMAKRMLKRQWKSYVTLGDVFLENIQGMTTLKVFSADTARQEAMDAEAERFRKSTMRVLKMQLNSILVMDVIAYGGAALGVILAARNFASGSVTFAEAIAISLLSAEFFIPLRQLGSFFHVAMTGMAASERMFQMLDMPEHPDGMKTLSSNAGELGAKLEEVSFSYGQGPGVLKNLSLTLAPGGLTSLVGESGSGKSTIAAILAGRRAGYGGSATLGGIELRDVSRESLRKHIALLTHDGYVFAGTVAENLKYAKPSASDSELKNALDQVGLLAFLETSGGLNFKISERGANLSGGQRQRLCAARALLRDCDFYIFDEATSNIDAESEEAIMDAIHDLASKKTVLLITHRLANAVNSKRIYLLKNGLIQEEGTHTELLDLNGDYARLFNEQSELERYGTAVLA
ncbi:MAG: ABC transporter ATP-binding protein/permease [Clostridiales bacterium]|jgi:ABC-type transport system involved in cytochrome bd biosynthesis fused ATPase/permease subunit|nr:ABC transporter ATP-binding protein/permease [Clostridiales bacterium]